MAHGDRVVIGAGSVFGGTKQEYIMGYDIGKDGNGEPMVDHNGNVIQLVKLGGIKVGTFGSINSGIARAHRHCLAEHEKASGNGYGTDMVEIVEVKLDVYERTAWFQIDQLRVVG